MTEKTEFRWMIERGDSEASKPLYWTGTDIGTNHTAWTHDPNNGIGFSSETFAWVIVHNLMGRGDGRMRCRVAQHGFG